MFLMCCRAGGQSWHVRGWGGGGEADTMGQALTRVRELIYVHVCDKIPRGEILVDWIIPSMAGCFPSQKGEMIPSTYHSHDKTPPRPACWLQAALARACERQ